MPGMSVSFTTTLGTLKEVFVVTDTDGKAETDLISETTDGTAWVTATSSAENTVGVQFIAYNPAYIVLSSEGDSENSILADGNSEINIIAEVYNSANQIIPWALIDFSTTQGSLNKATVRADQAGKAIVTLTSAGSAWSYLADVTSADQGGLKIYANLWFAPNEVIDSTESRVIPGVEALISTVDDDVMGDGESWALVKATLRETTGNKAITDVGIDWATTLGTIIGRSKTNTTGHTIDTLRIENSVSTNTDVTITANFGENVSASDIVTFISPVGPNRLILGFEPDTTTKDTIPIPCDIPDEFAVRDVGISALYVNALGNPIGGQIINFSVVPNNFAAICALDTTVSDR